MCHLVLKNDSFFVKLFPSLVTPLIFFYLMLPINMERNITLQFLIKESLEAFYSESKKKVVGVKWVVRVK